MAPAIGTMAVLMLAFPEMFWVLGILMAGTVYLAGA